MIVQAGQPQPRRGKHADIPIRSHRCAARFKRLAAARPDKTGNERKQQLRAIVIRQAIIPRTHERRQNRAGALRMIGPRLARYICDRLHGAHMHVVVFCMAAGIKLSDRGKTCFVDLNCGLHLARLHRWLMSRGNLVQEI